MLTTISTTTAIVCYLAATAILSKQLFFREHTQNQIPRNLCLGFATLALVAHGLLLSSTTFVDGGLNLGVSNAFSLFGWFIALLLIGTSLTSPVHNLGIVVFPLATLALLADNMTSGNSLVTSNASKELQLHIIISLFAYSLLTIAALQSILLAIQDRHLRSKQLGGFMRVLPPLETMETLLFRIITLGFIFHSMSLITGAVFLENMFAQHLAHKTLFSLVAWLVFAVLLWGRWRFGWRGRIAIRWTMSGFVALLLAYFGTKMVLEVFMS